METFRQYGIDLPNSFSGDKKTTCPRCSHTRKKKHDPCLSVNGSTGVWRCHNCGWSGGLKEERPFAPTRQYAKPKPDAVKIQMDPRVLAFFAKRKISAETLKTAKVFSDVHYLPGSGENTLSMAFPYYKDGELINIKYRDAQKNMAQVKDPEPSMYNIDACKKAEVIYITEGEIDTLTLIECGFLTAVSVDKGAPNPRDKDASKKLECVQNNMDTLNCANSIVLVTDKDEPGLRLERELLDLLGPEKCKLVKYPTGCKDINDVLMQHGKEAVASCIAAASPAPVPGLRNVKDFAADIEAFWRKGKPRRLSTGFTGLDKYFTFQLGSVTTITGIPTSGKSEFLHQLIINANIIHGWKTVIFSPEMLPAENLISNFMEKLVGKPFLGDPDKRITHDEYIAALDKLNENLFPIIPDAYKTPTLEDLLLTAQVCIDRYGIKVLAIDPFNEIDHSRPSHMTEHEYIGQFMSRLVKFARQNKICVFLVAHPIKLKKDEKTKKFPVATLYDIAGSSNFFNKTDNGLSLWRELNATNNVVQVHVQKIKNKHVGLSGTYQELEWDRSTGRFSEPQPPPPPPDHTESKSQQGGLFEQ